MSNSSRLAYWSGLCNGSMVGPMDKTRQKGRGLPLRASHQARIPTVFMDRKYPIQGNNHRRKAAKFIIRSECETGFQY